MLHDTTNYTQSEIVAALQDFIVCLEMLFAALAHHFAFSYKQWHDEERMQQQQGMGPRPMLPALLEALNITDVYVRDVRQVTHRSRPQRARDNPQLTREEIHQRQYASFIAAQQNAVATTALGNNTDDLTAPLKSDSLNMEHTSKPARQLFACCFAHVGFLLFAAVFSFVC